MPLVSFASIFRWRIYGTTVIKCHLFPLPPSLDGGFWASHIPPSKDGGNGNKKKGPLSINAYFKQLLESFSLSKSLNHRKNEEIIARHISVWLLKSSHCPSLVSTLFDG
jgi:hypothetical protein